MDKRRNLPLTVTLDDETILKGFQKIQPADAKPTLAKGIEITLAPGSPKDIFEVSDVFLKNNEAIFKWSQRYTLFVIHVVSISREGEPVCVKAFRGNKAKCDAEEE
jgi:hypothetical protein